VPRSDLPYILAELGVAHGPEEGGVEAALHLVEAPDVGKRDPRGPPQGPDECGLLDIGLCAEHLREEGVDVGLALQGVSRQSGGSRDRPPAWRARGAVELSAERRARS